MASVISSVISCRIALLKRAPSMMMLYVVFVQKLFVFLAGLLLAIGLTKRQTFMQDISKLFTVMYSHEKR